MSDRLNSARARDIAYHLHPYTNASAHEKEGPLVITRGEGVYVYDDAGNRYIEGLAGLFCASLGFSEERLVEAATRQMRTLPFYHVFGGKSNEPGIELAERLIKLAPVPMSKVFFANSGSEANDTAVKLVWYYHNAIGKPQKKKIISRVESLSRRHCRDREPHRPFQQPSRFRSADQRHSSHRLPWLLPLRQRR